MDASEASWLSDLLLKETEDCNLFQQCHLETLLDDDDELLSHEIAIAFENLHQPLSSETFERPTKQHKTNASSSPSSPTSKKQVKNKGVSVSVSLPQTPKRSSENHNFETESPKGQRSYKFPSYARDHIIAERKRRQKLSQSLIALAALIPGLKKMDKATVLGDAIKYVKELQERLRMLEEENKKRDVDCVVMVNKARLSCEDDIDGSASREDEEGSERLPRVEARVSEKDVLLRIQCQKQKGLLLKILAEIQKFHLFVVNSSVLPFGDSILDITIVAQMGTGYNLTINDIVKNLLVATLKSMS